MITGLRTAVAAAFAFGALSVSAAGITISIESSSSDARDVALVARRVDGVASPIDIVVRAPGKTDVALPAGLWELRVTGDAWWAAPVYVRDVDDATMRFWPALPLKGTSNGVTRLRVQFTPLDRDRASGEVECGVERDRWTCLMPQGRFDVRFSAPGMAPEFRSDVAVSPRATELALRFVAGSSLYGCVDANGEPVEGTEVTLQGGGGQQVARADRKGFFQFKGLAAGEYSLAAKKRALIAPARVVNVLAGLAAEVREPLLLDTPKRLTVLILPPLDPDGEPWRLHFHSRTSTETIEDRASPIGTWTRERLVAGLYDLAILDNQGGRWTAAEVAIGSEDVTLSVAASGTKIRGRVLIGDRPLRAKLSFGGEWGRTLESDDDGQFVGEIPLDKDVERLIFVEAEPPNVRRSVRAKIEAMDSGELRLLLELPGTTLMGVVVNPDRTPVPHAILSASGEGDVTLEQSSTEDDGRFQIEGLAPGIYKVVADTVDGRSKPKTVDLTEREPAEIELVLESAELLRGKMTMGETPVVAATIFVLPRDAWGPTVPQAKTNERGQFQLRLPPGTTIFDGIAVHPAFDTVIARGTVRSDRVAWVPTNQIGGTLTVTSKTPDDVLLLHKGAEFVVSTVASLSGGVVAAEQTTLARLEPGEYSVCLRDRSACASGYLPPHGSLTLAPK